jgi:hypothetical protein
MNVGPGTNLRIAIKPTRPKTAATTSRQLWNSGARTTFGFAAPCLPAYADLTKGNWKTNAFRPPPYTNCTLSATVWVCG